MLAKKIKNTINETYIPQRYTFNYVEEYILEPCAEELDEKLKRIKRDSRKRMGEKILMRFYTIGPVSILASEMKTAGIGANDVDLFILDNKDHSKAKRFYASNGYEGFKDEIKERYYELTGINPSEFPIYDSQNNWFENKLRRYPNVLKLIGFIFGGYSYPTEAYKEDSFIFNEFFDRYPDYKIEKIENLIKHNQELFFNRWEGIPNEDDPNETKIFNRMLKKNEGARILKKFVDFWE